MRWQTEAHPIDSIRYIKRFAYFPRSFGSTRIWLESYYVKQIWLSVWTAGEYVPKWVELSEHMKDDIEISPLNKALK